jgi:hypothetical protein
MSDDDNATGEHAQCDKPLLAMVEAVILEADGRPSSMSGASSKLRPCFARLWRAFAPSHS